MKTVASGPDAKTALLLAGAVLEARRKHVRPDYKIEVPGYHVAELVLGNDSGLAEGMGFTACEDAEPRRQLLVFRADGEHDALPSGGWWTPAACALPPARADLGLVAGGLIDLYTRATTFETSLRDSVRAATAQLRPRRTLCIAGHGMGGALATLATLDILVNKLVSMSRVELYTFGAPPAGDAAFASALEGALDGNGIACRVVNSADAATSLEGEKAGYRHAGIAWTFASDTGEAWGNHSLERSYLTGVSGMRG